jgi:phytoene dehydrogenase-like protein
MGGLTAGCLLAKCGVEVTLLEAHTYPGGCAGHFPYQGFHFPAGATLAGGFAETAPLGLLARCLDLSWPGKETELAMTVHGATEGPVRLWTSPERWRQERREHFGTSGEPFWDWQEARAQLLWSLALSIRAWPPRTVEVVSWARELAGWWRRERPGVGMSARIARDALSTLTARLPANNRTLRCFVDGQCLISAQTLAVDTNALYGAAALSLSHSGVRDVPMGTGGIAETLAQSLTDSGGKLLFKQRVGCIRPGPRGVELSTQRRSFAADHVLINLPRPDALSLLRGTDPGAGVPHDAWGAFVVHAGVRDDFDPGALHHQVLSSEGWGEGHSLFASFSARGDLKSAPPGWRALTVSTHTRLSQWWASDPFAYDQKKERLTERLLGRLEDALPGLRGHLGLVIAGTPRTYARFTGRSLGWVGGYPQSSIFRHRSPRLHHRVWLVGDSVFPGQSVPAVCLSGMQAAWRLIGTWMRPLPSGRVGI